ncbi:hypothetical protein CCHR01_08800 [Colletotrichum chrysophilum]|uniref:Uncharacterized protein n=1 Tax=Colletotrichum chrysophilum TaxID=1836956 RepID=A0AAD9AHV5_9PEZI|nr:hypothetical protein CCHR01_08800 [Colletotrichum chrysophilum]
MTPSFFALSSLHPRFLSRRAECASFASVLCSVWSFRRSSVGFSGLRAWNSVTGIGPELPRQQVPCLASHPLMSLVSIDLGYLPIQSVERVFSESCGRPLAELVQPPAFLPPHPLIP